MSDTVYIENTLFLVTNEDGDVTADMDRDAAIERMNDDYGGEILRVVEMKVKVPRPRDYVASITLPEEGGEVVTEVTQG